MSEFRFQRLLDIKEKLLEHKQAELEIALASVASVVEQIRQAEEEIAETYAPLTTRCLTGQEFSGLVDYLSYLDSKKVRLREEKKEREERVTLLREELRALETERKVLEKLRFKALQAIRKAQNKKDQKLMDELALRRPAR
jgi:flagellar export protein FliJ